MKGAKTMKVLITAGGTRENIDSVRSISNHSTGRLGSMIASKFVQKNADIFYVCGEKAVVPSVDNITVLRIKNVEGLLGVMEDLLENHRFDCVVHSMAVGDFVPRSVHMVDDIVSNVLDIIQKTDIKQADISEKIKFAVLASGKPLSDKKISSQNKDLLVLMKQTPKVIGLIKSKQPKTVLVGFKLSSGVLEDELMKAAQGLLTRNSCDFVLANDLRNIKGDEHKAFLIDENGIVQKADTKQEISELIYKTVVERIENK